MCRLALNKQNLSKLYHYFTPSGCRSYRKGVKHCPCGTQIQCGWRFLAANDAARRQVPSCMMTSC